MTLEQEIEKGAKAEALMSDPLIVEAFAHMEAELFAKFQELSPSDEKSILFVKQMQYMHGKYKEFFHSVIANGKVAKFNLEAKKSLADRVRAALD